MLKVNNKSLKKILFPSVLQWVLPIQGVLRKQVTEDPDAAPNREDNDKGQPLMYRENHIKYKYVGLPQCIVRDI